MAGRRLTYEEREEIAWRSSLLRKRCRICRIPDVIVVIS